MAIQRVTLIGAFNYDSSIFDGMSFPDGIDKETVINSLLFKYGESPLLYADFDFLKITINAWSIKWYAAFERIVRAMTEEYNPLHNFDRHEDYTDSEHTTGTTDGTSNATSKGAVEDGISAYNASTYQPDSKRTSDSDVNETSTLSNEGTRDLMHNAHLYGNIGVTKSQEMLKDEIDVRINNNIYDIICDKFRDDFILYLY